MGDRYYIRGERRDLHGNVKTADDFSMNSEPRSVALRDLNTQFSKIKQRQQIIIHGERFGLYMSGRLMVTRWSSVDGRNNPRLRSV
jgi:hypothetical protein